MKRNNEIARKNIAWTRESEYQQLFYFFVVVVLTIVYVLCMVNSPPYIFCCSFFFLFSTYRMSTCLSISQASIVFQSAAKISIVSRIHLHIRFNTMVHPWHPCINCSIRGHDTKIVSIGSKVVAILQTYEEWFAVRVCLCWRISIKSKVVTKHQWCNSNIFLCELNSPGVIREAVHMILCVMLLFEEKTTKH